MQLYEENFARATSVFEADPYLTVKLLFRKGDPAGAGLPAFTAAVRRNGGWFGPLNAAPDLPRDEDVVTEQDLQIYADALRRNGFFGPDSYYMNHAANAVLVAGAPELLALPVLFLHALRLCVRNGALPPCRAHARAVPRLDRANYRQRTLDGAGAAACGECGAGALAGYAPRHGLAASSLLCCMTDPTTNPDGIS